MRDLLGHGPVARLGGLMVQLFFAGVVIGSMLIMPAALLAPAAGMLVSRRVTRGRVVAVVALYYLALTPVAGVGAYASLPADYTVRHQLTLHPVSNTLAEIHAVDLQLIRQGVYSGPAAERRRSEIARERRAFAQDWLALAAAGLAPLGAELLAFSAVRRTAGPA